MSDALELLNKQQAFTSLAVVALQLGSMEGQADILRGRHLPFGPQTKNNLDALLGATIFIAWLVSSVWLFRTWPWYAWLGATVAMMLLARRLITRRTLGSWLTLRPQIAVATAGSAGILWLFAVWP
jgi:hypothetical protein